MRLALPAELDLATAPGLVDRLREGLRTGQELCLDAAGVETVSTACIQALLAATRDAGERKVRLVIANPAPALDEAVAELGLRDWLNDWSAA